MGAHLKFKLAYPSKAEEVNDWLADQPEQQRFEEIGRGRLYFWTEADRQDAKDGLDRVPDFYPDLGEGDVKVSGLGRIEDPDEMYELWADLFEKLHAEYDVNVLGASCALRPAYDEHGEGHEYFTEEQYQQITNDGDALSGSRADDVKAKLD